MVITIMTRTLDIIQANLFNVHLWKMKYREVELPAQDHTDNSTSNNPFVYNAVHLQTNESWKVAWKLKNSLSPSGFEVQRFK